MACNAAPLGGVVAVASADSAVSSPRESSDVALRKDGPRRRRGRRNYRLRRLERFAVRVIRYGSVRRDDLEELCHG